MNEYNILIGLACLVIGFIIASWIKGKVLTQETKDAEKEALRIIEEAKQKAESVFKQSQIESKDILFKMKNDFETETRDLKNELKKQEVRLIQKEENIDRKNEQLERRDREITRKEKKMQKREADAELKELKYNELVEEQKKQLEKS